MFVTCGVTKGHGCLGSRPQPVARLVLKAHAAAQVILIWVACAANRVMVTSRPELLLRACLGCVPAVTGVCDDVYDACDHRWVTRTIYVGIQGLR